MKMERERERTKHEFMQTSLLYFRTTGFILANCLCLSVFSHSNSKEPEKNSKLLAFNSHTII